MLGPYSASYNPAQLPARLPACRNARPPAHLLHRQGEMAMRIDENVDDSLANVDAGQAQLLKYLSAISSNRWVTCSVVGAVVVMQ